MLTLKSSVLQCALFCMWYRETLFVLLYKGIIVCREAKEKARPTAQDAADRAKGMSKDAAGSAKKNVDTGAGKAKEALSTGDLNI